MTHDDARTKILSFAAHIGRRHTAAEATALRRNWLSPSGDVTPDGTALIEALDDQSATRTVFRGNI